MPFTLLVPRLAYTPESGAITPMRSGFDCAMAGVKNPKLRGATMAPLAATPSNRSRRVTPAFAIRLLLLHMMSSLVFALYLRWCRAGSIRSRVENGGDDPLITSAAAEVSGELLAHPGLVGVRLAPQQVERGQHHAWRAKAALQAMIAAKCLLQWMQLGTARQRFDGGDLSVAHLDREHQARAHRRAVKQEGAGAADAMFAAPMHPGKADAVAQEIGQQRARLCNAGVGLPIHPHVQCDDVSGHGRSQRATRPPAPSAAQRPAACGDSRADSGDRPQSRSTRFPPGQPLQISGRKVVRRATPVPSQASATERRSHR